MKQNIVHIALVVKDYDEAIDFYVNKLKFELIEDTPQPNKTNVGWLWLHQILMVLRCYLPEPRSQSSMISLEIKLAVEYSCF